MKSQQWVAFGFGLLAGALAAGIVALMYAPRSGKETRAQLGNKTDTILEVAKSRVGGIRHSLGEKISGEECTTATAVPHGS